MNMYIKTSDFSWETSERTRYFNTLYCRMQLVNLVFCSKSFDVSILCMMGFSGINASSHNLEVKNL